MSSRQDSWENRLGSPLDGALSTELRAGSPAPDDPSFFVYLCGGSVEEVRPSNSLSMTSDAVVFHYGAAAVASYPRGDVLFCSRSGASPFPS